jgi:hypothetical protein
MLQILAGRGKLCVYSKEMQQERVVHAMLDVDRDVRLLVHFYAFLFFQDWREELLMKRFVRDHVRYRDDVQCAAAQMVAALRDHVRQKAGSTGRGQGGEFGAFDTMHVRRGDLTTLEGYNRVTVNASDIVESVRDVLVPGSTVYISTEESDKFYFEPFKSVYDVKFLDGA